MVSLTFLVYSSQQCNEKSRPPGSILLTELRENLQSEAGKPAIFEFAI